MAMKLERAKEVGAALKTLVIAVNTIREEDIDELLRSVSREEALGPMLDPTAWRDGNMFGTMQGTKQILEALLEFKEAVSGIGDFKGAKK